MPGIPSDLKIELRKTLLTCDEFREPQWLRAVMGAELLRPWQDRLPQAGNVMERVDLIIDFLGEERRSTGENVLGLLVRTLAEARDPADSRRMELIQLAERLDSWTLAARSVPAATQPAVEVKVTGGVVQSTGYASLVNTEVERALASNLASKSLVLVLGGDLSQTVTGIPSRAELARGLVKALGLDSSLNEHGFTAIVQQVDPLRRAELVAWLSESLAPRGPLMNFYRRLATLIRMHGIRTVLTLAYDDRLESALREIGMMLNRLGPGSYGATGNLDQLMLLKLNGEISTQASLVLTTQDRAVWMQDREYEPLVEKMRRAVQRNTLLFLGCDPEGGDFRFLLEEVAGGRFARTAYAIWPGLTEMDVQMWKSRGVWMLETDPWGLLARESRQ
jgi:hypothetical protein